MSASIKRDFNTFLDLGHLIHPGYIPGRYRYPALIERICAATIYIFTLPFTLGIFVGFSYYWAHRKAVRVESDKEASIALLFQQSVFDTPLTKDIENLYKNTLRAAMGASNSKLGCLIDRLENEKVLSPSLRNTLAAAAILKGRQGAVEYLIKRYEKSYPEWLASEKERGLYLHVAPGLKMAETLTGFGANVNGSSDKGLTPLHVISDVQVIQMLISKGANIHSLSKCDLTPMHLCRNVKAAKCLVSYSVSPLEEFRTPEGITPLHTCDDPEVARYLLELGFNVNEVSTLGLTPLHTCQNESVVKILLEQGANPKLTTASGNTPLHLTRKKKVANLLIGAGADIYAMNNKEEIPNPLRWEESESLKL